MQPVPGTEVSEKRAAWAAREKGSLPVRCNTLLRTERVTEANVETG